MHLSTAVVEVDADRDDTGDGLQGRSDLAPTGAAVDGRQLQADGCGHGGSGIGGISITTLDRGPVGATLGWSSTEGSVQVDVLGPLEVRQRDGSPVHIGAPKVRRLVVALALGAGRVVPTEQLIDAVWGEQPPARALVSLRSYVSNLRALLVDGDHQPLRTRGRGYLLEVDDLDVDRFVALAAAARSALAAGRASTALSRLDEGLALWRGPALVDVADVPFAEADIVRLDELCLGAREDRIDALLALGRDREAAVDGAALAKAEPLRERPRRQLMLALHRTGRTPEALDVHHAFRELLAEELGLDPSPALTELAGRILQQDPTLAAAAPIDEAAPPDAPDPSRTAAPSVVGRHRERHRLAEAVDAVRAGRGSVLLLHGEPGIGKTAMLGELDALARAAGVPTAWGRCQESGGAPAFWPWTEVVRELAERLDVDELCTAAAGHGGAVGHLVPEVAVRTGRSHAIDGTEPYQARFALHDAVATFLERCASSGGLVVVVEDLHWADLASCELAAFLGERVEGAGIVLALSHRDTPAEMTPQLEQALARLVRTSSTTQLGLHGLDLDDVAALVDDLPVDGSDVDAARIHQRSGGNPFYARQLVRLLADGGSGEVPIGVRQVVGRRVAQLAPAVRDLLEVAAVVGEDVDAALVAGVSGTGFLEVLDGLDLAVAHGLVDPGDAPAATYRFAHALVREALLAELPTGRSMRLHAAVGAQLAASPAPTAQAVAEHLWHAAEVVGHAEPVRWLRVAAEEATAVFAHEQAEQALRRALHLLQHQPDGAADELAVRLRLIQVLNSLHGWTAGEIEEVAGRVFELADTGGIGPELTAMWWALWAMSMTRGELVVARAAAHRLLDAVREDGEPDEVLAGHMAVAYSETFLGTDLTVVLSHLDAATEAEAASDPVRLAATPEHLAVAVRISRAIAHALAGEREPAVAAAADAVAVSDAVGDSFRRGYARLFGAWTGALLDDPDLALAHSTTGLALCERAGLQGIAALILPNHVWAAARCGGDAATMAAEGARVDAALVAAGQRHAVPHGRLLLAEVHLLAGDRAGAEHWLAAADTMADEIGEHVYGRTRARVATLVDAPPVGATVAAG